MTERVPEVFDIGVWAEELIKDSRWRVASIILLASLKDA